MVAEEADVAGAVGFEVPVVSVRPEVDFGFFWADLGLEGEGVAGGFVEFQVADFGDEWVCGGEDFLVVA